MIVSDTHRNESNYYAALEKETPIDLLIHCGDAEGREAVITQAAACPTEIILGNNDFFSNLPREKEIELNQYHIWITHGHQYNVSMGNELLKEEARSRGTDIVLYGHTHKPVIEAEEGLLTMNPGSLTYPRQEGRRPSYIILELNENQEPQAEIKYL